jgi:hypothetical protein
MFMHSQCLRAAERFIQHDVIWTYEFSCAGHIDAYPEDVAVVYRVRVGIADEESRDACAGAVEVFLVVFYLGCAGVEEGSGVGGEG